MKATLVPSGEMQGSSPLINFRALLPSKFAVQRVESRAKAIRRCDRTGSWEREGPTLKRETRGGENWLSCDSGVSVASCVRREFKGVATIRANPNGAK